MRKKQESKDHKNKKPHQSDERLSDQVETTVSAFEDALRRASRQVPDQKPASSQPVRREQRS